jgi:hypothetical protein
MNPLPSTAKTQFIKRAQFLAKDSGDPPGFCFAFELSNSLLENPAFP